MPTTLSPVARLSLVVPAWWRLGVKVGDDYLARHPDWEIMDDTPRNGDEEDMRSHQWRVCHMSPYEMAYRCGVDIGTIQDMGFDCDDARRIGVVEDWLQPDPFTKLHESPPLCFLRDCGHMRLIDGYHRLYVAIHVFNLPQIPVLVGVHFNRVGAWSESSVQ